MCDPKAVSYVFGELADEELAEFELRLLNDPELREQVERVRESLDGCEGGTCPRGLADRTFHEIRAARALAACEALASPASRCRWSLADVTLGSLAIAAVLMLAAPAVLASRETARNTACVHNLERLGQASMNYATYHQRRYPHVSLDENAGRFVLRLVDSGYLPRSEWTSWVVCPSSPEAEWMLDADANQRMPTAEQLSVARGEQLVSLQRRMGGSYAYRVGYFESCQYQSVQKRSDCRSALLSDAPRLCADGRSIRASFNHGVAGQNVFFDDGQVRRVVGCIVPVVNDHLFLNASGDRASGQTWRDAVLLRSEDCPWGHPTPATPSF
ncbi:hypothetical protein Mal64_15190 [Pseudobythopirellula maris]|uniref:DUF1559 domain-containing protein n=1 Tax=Pseudobythopirellula maris TaxID=2527991 RepID=A0A5C5ZV56_9BACT|nr:hypothetical protein [Pseudobythopirellula maris]TWT91120.1 hypothetical protein Mal64_15190 [Pseudobythopirellula maris]